jgi:hypothetical protein
MSKIYPSAVATPDRIGHIFLTAINPIDGSTLRARDTEGIQQTASGSGAYYLLGGLNAAVAYTKWDDDGAAIGAGWEMLAAPDAAVAPIVLPAGGLSPVVTGAFYIKRGDDEPIVFAITELDSSGRAIVQDVTGWTGKFKLRAEVDVGTVLINEDFYISDAAGNPTSDGTAGLLAYAWPNVGDTDREGVFLAEFECHRSDGIKKTYPTTSDLTKEYITVHFVADLDDSGSF